MLAANCERYVAGQRRGRSASDAAGVTLRVRRNPGQSSAASSIQAVRAIRPGSRRARYDQYLSPSLAVQSADHVQRHTEAVELAGDRGGQVERWPTSLGRPSDGVRRSGAKPLKVSCTELVRRLARMWGPTTAASATVTERCQMTDS